ncbi:MAG: protein kinase [Acidobacteriota bacterium]
MTNDFLGTLVADKYRIESLISESGSGDIYLGRHEVMDKPVMIKILAPTFAADPRRVKQFVDESRSASAASHPNILNITDFGTDAKGTSYAIFEEAKGLTLKDIVAISPMLEEGRALNITHQIASAVAAAHAKQVIHGDLGPQYVYVNHEVNAADNVKVYGFGRDRLHVADDADPRFLAPEQCTAFPAADERSDVYSLGVMLYEMLSGVVPFNGTTVAEVVAKQNSEPPAPLSAFRQDLQPMVETIVLRATAADPDKRYPTMAAFAGDIDSLSNGLAGKAATSTGPKRNIWQTAFVVLLGISVLAVALIYNTSTRSTDPTTQLQAEAGTLPVQPIGPATGAQEESLAKLPPMTDAELTAAGDANTAIQSGALPGGDGLNPWANGGTPPAGAPQYVPPGGQTLSGDPNSASQFMPPSDIPPGCSMLPSGIVLCPKQIDPAAKPSPTPKNSNANTVVQPTPTPKPMATPTPKADKPATPSTKPAKTPIPKPGEPE